MTVGIGKGGDNRIPGIMWTGEGVIVYIQRPVHGLYRGWLIILLPALDEDTEGV